MAVKRKTVVIIITFLLSLALIFVLIHLSQKRDHSYYNAEYSLIDGKIIRILVDQSTRKVWFAFPPRHSAYVLGGGDLRNDIYFEVRGVRYHFQTTAVPFLINRWGKSFFIVTLGFVGSLENGTRRQVFRFFKSKGNLWDEVEAEKFPKSIAIPNVYYIRSYPVLKEPKAINPELKNFRMDFTAVLWMRLEKGVRIFELDDPVEGAMEVDKEFLIDYKQKYIEPYWDEDKFKKNIPKCSKASEADLSLARD